MYYKKDGKKLKDDKGEKMANYQLIATSAMGLRSNCCR